MLDIITGLIMTGLAALAAATLQDALYKAYRVWGPSQVGQQKAPSIIAASIEWFALSRKRAVAPNAASRPLRVTRIDGLSTD